MTAELTPLAEAFVSDHRRITRGLSRLRKAVRSGDFAAALNLAGRLDRIAGPHIQFEEEVLYPHIARLLGQEYAAQLYREHAAGRTVLERLQQPGRPASLSGDERQELEPLLETAVEHAGTCGTLVSHLAEASPALQDQMYARLLASRSAGPRWTELPESGPESAAPPVSSPARRASPSE